MNKRFSRDFYFLYISSLVLLASGAYLFGQIYGVPFAEDFWADLFATFIGVIIGIPIALYIYAFQEMSRREHEKIEEEKRKEKILSAIKNELEFNKDLLTKAKEVEIEEEGKGLNLVMANVETWKAFSEGGEIQWIKDPKLVNRLANVYYSLKYFNYENEKNFDFAISTSNHVNFLPDVVLKNISEVLVENCDKSLAHIDEILELI